MKRTLILLYLILTVGYIHGQDNSDISRLETILFEYDKDKPLYEYTFWYRKHKKSMKVYSRFESHPDKFKHDKVHDICKSIRRYERIDLIPKLQEILQRHESYFLKEWEPVWDYRGGPEGLWDDHCKILCTIDLTINYLKMIKEEWTAEKKYKYLKNVYMLNYGDYDTTRVAKVMYNSAYLRDKRKYCLCEILQPKFGQPNMIAEAFLRDEDMLFYLIEDISSNDEAYISDDEGRFFSQGMDYVLQKTHSKEIDSLILNNPIVFINSGYRHEHKISKGLMTIMFYQLVLNRYKRIPTNYKLVQLLLDDLFQKHELIFENEFALDILKGYSDGLIEYMLMDEFIQLFASSKSQEELDRLERFVKKVYTLKDIKMLKDRAKKYSTRDKLSLSTLKQIENM